MSKYIKSSTETQRLRAALVDISDKFTSYKTELKQNNLELSKINKQIEFEREKAIKELEEKIIDMEKSIRWVKSSEPALKVDTPADILKKLDIL